MAFSDVGKSMASVAAEAANKAAEAASYTANIAAATAASQKSDVFTTITKNIANCESKIEWCKNENTSLQRDIEDLVAAQKYFDEMASSFSAAVSNSLSRWGAISSVLGVAGAVISGSFFGKRSDELFRGPACKQAQHAIDNALAKIKEKMNQLQKEIDNNNELIHTLAQTLSEFQKQLNASQNG